MAIPHFGRVGFRGDFFRLQNRVSQDSPRTFFPVQGPQEPNSGRGLFAGSSLSSFSRGYRTCPTSRTVSGFLFQSVCGPQKRRFGTSDLGFKISQPVSAGTTFPDGVSPGSDRVHGTKRISFLCRHNRRISACPNCCFSPAFSSFCGGFPPLSVCGAAFRVSDGPAGFHKDTRSCNCSSSEQGSLSDPVSGRYHGQSAILFPKSGQFINHSAHPYSVRLDHQLQEVLPISLQVPIIPGDGVPHREGQSFSSHGETDCTPPESQASDKKKEVIHPFGNEGFGDYGVIHRSHSFCAVSHTPSSRGDSKVVGQDTFFPGSSDDSYSRSVQRAPMVDKLLGSESGKILPSVIMDNYHDRCQSPRLGRSLHSSYSSGNLVCGRIKSTHQHSGASGNIPLTGSLDSAFEGPSDSHSDRQRNSGGVLKSSGRHAQRGGDEGSIQDSTLGGSTRSGPVSNSHPRCRKLDGGFSQQRKSGPGRVVSSPTDLRGSVLTLGSSRCGPDGIQVQSQSPKVLVTDARPSLLRGRRSGGSVAGFSAPLRVSTDSSSVLPSQENQEGRDSGNSNCSGLAPTTLVRRPRQPPRRRSVATPASQRPTVAGSDVSSAFRTATFDGVAVESAILKARGFDDNVIRTMMGARKPVSAKVYHRIWRSFFLWCEEHSFPPLEFSLSRILSFLQKGLDLGLALSSLKGQVSALSILFQKPLASKDAVRTFLQGVARIAPPYRSPVSPWDLNLVLSVLQGPPFEPLKDISLRFLSWKVAFLVAITSLRRVSEIAALSCRSPFLVLHQDKVVLRPPPEFLPKVVSKFHINEDIVLPSFCPSPSHPKEKALHYLDVVRAIRIYLSVSAGFRRSDSLFVIPEGPRKGQAASKATIARWIRLVIAEAYRVRGKTPPIRVVAHSTRAVGASWAMHHQASASQLCKAATWSSLHTFSKFYRVHTFASADASVGRKILQAAVN